MRAVEAFRRRSAYFVQRTTNTIMLYKATSERLHRPAAKGTVHEARQHDVVPARGELAGVRCAPAPHVRDERVARRRELLPLAGVGEALAAVAKAGLAVDGTFI